MKVTYVLLLVLISLISIKCIDDSFVVTVSLSQDVVGSTKARLSSSLVRWLEAAATFVYPIHFFTDPIDENGNIKGDTIRQIISKASGVVVYLDPEDDSSATPDVLNQFNSILKIIIDELKNKYWTEKERIDIPLIIIGDADYYFFKLYSGLTYDYDNTASFLNTAVSPYFNNIQLEGKSIFKGFQQSELLAAQASKCVYLNTNLLMTFAAFNKYPNIKGNFEITSFFTKQNTRYVLSLVGIQHPIHILKFRPDMVTYRNLLKDPKFDQIPSTTQALRFNQKISEAFSIIMQGITNSITEDYINYNLFGRQSVQDVSNNQFYYLFDSSEKPDSNIEGEQSD